MKLQCVEDPVVELQPYAAITSTDVLRGNVSQKRSMYGHKIS